MFNQGQMDRIAGKLGYNGPMHRFNEFLASNPGAQQAYTGLENRARMLKMARGGVVKMVGGGTFTPEQIREFSQGKSDAEIAQAAQQYGVSAGELATAFNTTEDVIKDRAKAAGADLFVSSKPVTPPRPEPTQNMNVADTSSTVTSGSSIGDTVGQTVTGGTGTGTPIAPASDAVSTTTTATDTIDTTQPAPEMYQPQTSDYTAYMQNVKNIVDTGALTGAEAMNRIALEMQNLRDQGYNISDAEVANAINTAFGSQLTEQEVTDYVANTTGVLTDTGAGTGTVTDAGTGTLGQFMADAVTGTGTTGTGQTVTPANYSIEQNMMDRATAPALPTGGKVVAEGIGFDEATQQIGTGTGQVGSANLAATPTTATTATAATPTAMTAQTMQAATAAGQLQQTTAAVGAVSAPMQAQTMVPTSTEVANQQAAQIDQAVRIQAPQARQLTAEELVSAPADAQAAAQFAEQVQAAQAQPTPEATVQGQLANMMAQFEGGQTPPWAAGAMRNATAIMAQRGLGASSMAGQAIIQAAMESALPIATQDAQTMAQFEMQNLSNRQARAMLAAQQRAQFIGQEFDQEFQARVTNAAKISDIANMNFNAEQQIALENAQLAQSVDLANLSNRQAVQMANIAQIAQLEMTNLNNRQQAAVQNAQSFLQMDMANLSNEQQAVMFDAQSKVQALLSDTAAINAARQFNATSQQQTDQFFANLSTQVNQFNATQSNAMEQFNIEQENAINQFNAEVKNQRDQFNAQNQLIIAQSNAQWRRDIATADTAALNQANQLNAQAILGISEQAYANLWQAYEDAMEYAWQGGQNELDRINKLAQQRLMADAQLSAADATRDAAESSAYGEFVATALFGVPGATSSFGGFLNLS